MTKELEGVKELEELIKGFEWVINEQEKNPPKFKSDRYFFEAVKKYYQKAYEAVINHKPLVASGLFSPVELFHAMDISYFLSEYHSILYATSAPDSIFQYLDIAESYGLSNEICSPHRVALGLAMKKMVPRPSLAVSTATTCDQTLKLYDNLSNFYGIPAFMIDTPYGSTDQDIEYAKKEVQSLIKFLEEHTGQQLDYDRLGEVLELSKTAYDYWGKICQLRKTIPCPIGSKDSIKDFGVLMTAAGTPEGVRYFESRYNEIKEKVEKKEGTISDERHRVAWLYVLPLFDLGIADWMEEEYGAVIVMDTFGYSNPAIQLDPKNAIDFLARKPLKWGFIQLGWGDGGITGFSKAMAQQVKEYNADMAMVLAHWSCRQYCGTIKQLRDDVTQMAGVPFLIIDADILDSRVVSSAQIKTKITEFFKTTETRVSS
jgi:benzoyl-CoA reductase/2-hydroxyglutaryl-CoA dehydratase subunit BcrC/BadD/HgdB